MRDNLPPTATRRRLLQLSSATVAGILAGCSQNSSKTTPETSSSSTTQTTSSTTSTTESTTTTEQTTTEDPKTKLLTEYDSREKFKHPGTSYDDFEDVSGWEAKRKSVTADTSRSFVGSQSLKLSTDGHTGVIAEKRLEKPLNVENKDISFALRSENPLHVSFMVYLYDKDDNWVVLELSKITYRPPDVGWFRTSPGVFDVSDTPPDLSRIVRMRIEIGSSRDGGVEAHVDDMRLHPKPDKGYVIISWDDGDQNYYDKGAPINDKFEFPAVITMPVEPGKNKEPYFMTLDELHERQDKGDEIVIHGSGAAPFSEISKKKLDSLLKRNKQWMIDNGLDGANFIVYPGNNYDKSALEVIGKYCYMGGMNQSGNINTTGVHGFDPLILPRTIGSNLEISKRAVSLAAEHRQCTVLNFHNFDTHNTMSPKEYEKLLSHIDKTSGIEVIQFSDLWEMRRSKQ